MFKLRLDDRNQMVMKLERKMGAGTVELEAHVEYIEQISLTDCHADFPLFQWDLVCGSQTLNSVAKFIYMTGIFIGHLMGGHLSDK